MDPLQTKPGPDNFCRSVVLDWSPLWAFFRIFCFVHLPATAPALIYQINAKTRFSTFLASGSCPGPPKTKYIIWTLQLAQFTQDSFWHILSKTSQTKMALTPTCSWCHAWHLWCGRIWCTWIDVATDKTPDVVQSIPVKKIWPEFDRSHLGKRMWSKSWTVSHSWLWLTSCRSTRFAWRTHFFTLVMNRTGKCFQWHFWHGFLVVRFHHTRPWSAACL